MVLLSAASQLLSLDVEHIVVVLMKPSIVQMLSICSLLLLTVQMLNICSLLPLIVQMLNEVVMNEATNNSSDAERDSLSFCQ